MKKVIRCRDVGFDCNGVIKASTEIEALALAAEHAKAVHGVNEVSADMLQKIKSLIRDEA